MHHGNERTEQPMIASGYTPDSLIAQAYRAFHSLHRASSHAYKINHLRISTPGERVYAGVMQDKGIRIFLERICITLLARPTMGQQDMYIFYISYG